MDFIQTLLEEVEQKEERQEEAYYDLLLLEIQNLIKEQERNFTTANKEIELINNWVLKRNHPIQEKIDRLEKKLELFIKEKGVKTIDLAHGVLKLHKKPDKLEITDMDLFLQHAKAEMITIIPEQIKPDLNKIKAYLKGHYAVPLGITVLQGQEEFSYKLKEEETVGKEETGTNTEQTERNRIAV